MNLKEDWPLILIGLLVVGAVFSAMSSGGGDSSTSWASVSNGPNVLAIDQSNLAAQQTHEQNIFAAFGALTQFAEQHDSQTIEAALAGREANLAANVQTQEAALQASLTQKALDQQQSQFDAQLHAQQQESLWGQIFGVIGNIAHVVTGGLIGGTNTAVSNTVPGVGSVGENTAYATYGG